MNEYRVVVREVVELTKLVSAPTPEIAAKLAAPDPDAPLQPGPPMKNVRRAGTKVTSRRVVALSPAEAQTKGSADA